MVSTAKIQEIYNNCVRHAEDTEAFWQRVYDFLAPHYSRHPEVLEIYNALERYIYKKEIGKNESNASERIFDRN